MSEMVALVNGRTDVHDEDHTSRIRSTRKNVIAAQAEEMTLDISRLGECHFHTKLKFKMAVAGRLRKRGLDSTVTELLNYCHCDTNALMCSRITMTNNDTSEE